MNKFDLNSSLYIENWKKIISVHKMTTKFCLLAEECHDEFASFIYPMREQKDAYEHIINIMSKELIEEFRAEISHQKFVEEQFLKALNHEYRAFLDIADWLSIIYRTKIKQLLKGRNKRAVVEAFPEYEEFKEFLIECGEKIVEFRHNKDYSEENKRSVIDEYALVLNKLHKYYIEISKIFDAPLKPSVLELIPFLRK